MFQRYMRNIGPLTPEEQACLSSKTVFIAGLGGLGGHLMEHMPVSYTHLTLPTN